MPPSRRQWIRITRRVSSLGCRVDELLQALVLDVGGGPFGHLVAGEVPTKLHDEVLGEQLEGHSERRQKLLMAIACLLQLSDQVSGECGRKQRMTPIETPGRPLGVD